MSDWHEILNAFNHEDSAPEATEVLLNAVALKDHADAVKIFIALAALTRTHREQQGVAEAIARRLDGALAWNLVHMNRGEDKVRSVLDRAILLRIYGASHKELAGLLRRGLDEDPNLYGPLLLDAARTRPSEDLRSLAGYVVWREEFTSSRRFRPELAWSRLRTELEGIFGTDLPRYTQEVSEQIRDAQHIQEQLANISEGEELESAYALAEQTQGKFQRILQSYLIEWAQTRNDWTPLLEATNLPEDTSRGSLAREVLVLLHLNATPQDSVLALDSALRITTRNNWFMATAYSLGILVYLAKHKHSMELWKLAPLLRDQIMRETRHSFGSRLRGFNGGTLTEQGARFQNTLDALRSFLPEVDLPQPAEGTIETEQLPRPAVSGDFELESLPAPATEVSSNGSNPRWKRWTTKFKRS